MANLTGQPINTSYAGLIKTTDNAGIDGTFKQLTDGLGTNIPIEVSNADLRILSNQIQLTDVAQVNGFSITDLTMAFGGAIDFSAATVTGLPGGGGAAGLVAGTGLNSMKSADSLLDPATTTPAVASGQDAIALGDGSTASGTRGISIGKDSDATGLFSLALGTTARATSTAAVAIGSGALADTSNGVAIGPGSGYITGVGKEAVAIGYNSGQNSAEGSVAIGRISSATALNAVAIGNQVVAAIVDTASVKALEVQTDSTPTAGGIIMSDAGGTDRRINIDASGALQIDSTPVGGGGGAAGLVAGTGPNSMASAATLTTTAAIASGDQSIAIGNEAEAVGAGTTAIGEGATATGNFSVAYGRDAIATSGVAIGNDSRASGSFQPIAIGYSSRASNVSSIALGKGATALQPGAVAIGADVDANIAETLSTKALEVQTDSTPTAGGIIMSDAGGTDRRINIDATGNLQVDSNAINKAFNIPAFTVPTGPPATDTVYAVTTIPANTFTIGDVLEFRSMEQRAALDNICYESYFFSDTAQTPGSPVASGTAFQQAGIQSSSNGKLYYQKTMYIGATGTAVWNYSQPNDSYGNLVESGDPIETQAIDWTVDQYFYFQAFNDSATGTVQNYGTVLRKIN